MSFTLHMLFELLPEYHFDIRDPSFLSMEYKSIHLLPVDSANLNPEMVYITDFYDMERFQKFCDAKVSGKNHCLIFVYEQDDQFAPGASIYLKEEQEMAVILNRMQEIITDTMILERNLIDDVIQEHSLDTILSSIHTLLKNPIAVLDPTLKLVAHCETELPDDPLYQSLVSEGFLSEWWNHQMDDLQYFTAQMTPQHPYVACPPDEFSSHTRIFFQINLFPSVEATVYCVVTHQVYSGSLLSMIRMFVPHIKSKLLQLYSNCKSRTYDQFLRDLLSRTDMTDQEVRARAYSLGILCEGTYFLLSTAPIRTRAPVNYFLEQITALFPSALTVIWDEKAVILIRQTVGSEAIREALTPLFREYGYKGGISHRFRFLSDVRLAFEQSNAAQAISLHLEQSKFIQEFGLPVLQSSPQIYDYSEISVFHAYTLACHQIDFRSLCAPELLQLISYARKNNSSVVQVLYTYLITGCSFVTTAEKLHMHRNNVVYHIKRLKEIEHFDLDDHVFREKLMMTFAVLFLQEDAP